MRKRATTTDDVDLASVHPGQVCQAASGGTGPEY